MGVLKHLVAIVLSVSTWALLRMQNDFGPRDAFFPPHETNASIEQHFSENYYRARALFRDRARAAGAKLHALPLADHAHLGLTVDVAVLAGAKDKVMVHMSGTHGVEGFAGSAIQSAVLEKLSAQATSEQNGAGPTMIFVHAVNPYGFSQLRRFNERNVDLNRNWLADAEFKRLAEEDPNKNGYMDVFSLLNPKTDPSSWENWFWPRAAYDLATKGFHSIKQAVVSGNYHMPKTIFYGGSTMEPSLVALREFLATHVDFAPVKKLAVLDVHTGLGRSGEDTIFLTPVTTPGLAERVFRLEFRAGYAAHVSDQANAVVQGYADVVGYVAEGIAQMLPSPSSVEVLSFMQEFGTVPGVFIMKATAQENAFYQYAPTRRLAYAERLRDVFYTHNSASWKESVVVRGKIVFDKLYRHLQSE